jgi:hypothetical protein
VVRNLVDRLLDKVGLNRLAERSGLDRWTGRYRTSELAAKLVYYTILLIALQLGFGLFGPNPISDMIGAIVAHGVIAALNQVHVATTVTTPVLVAILATVGGVVGVGVGVGGGLAAATR